MPSDFKTALIEQSIIADITDEEVFGVQSGPAQSTYQQFQATTQSASSVVFNIQIPSENIVIDRNLHIQSTIAVKVNCSASQLFGTQWVQLIGTAGNSSNVNPYTGVPNPASAPQYGVDYCLQSFPFNSLLTTAQLTLNNVSTSTNLQDILPTLLRMNDKRKLSRWNSETPAYPDSTYGEYLNGFTVGANNNPMNNILSNGYDDDFAPRGAFTISNYEVLHYVNGILTDNSLLVSDVDSSITGSVTSAGAGDTWEIHFTVTVTEPFLALSPFINTDPLCKAGLVGINNMSMVLNVDNSCRRLISASTVIVQNGSGSGVAIGATPSSPITSVSLGYTNAQGQPVSPFANTRLLFNFLSLQPEQYQKISTKNVVPYMDYPRYLTISNSLSPIQPFETNYRCPSQAIQLNQIPDLIIISARVPMSNQNWNYANSFLKITNISVNFNNQSGLLASATANDLYTISNRNGSAQTWLEFNGAVQYTGAGYVSNSPSRYQYGNAPNGGATASFPEIAGRPYQLPASGSLLVLNPSLDFSLPSYLSASSLGQYQLQFNVTLENQFGYSFTPELCIVTMNSGLFITETGASQIFTGILTKEQVLKTKSENPVAHLDTGEYERLVGGKMGNRGMGAIGKMMKHYRKHHKEPEVMAMSTGAGSGGSSGGSHRMKKYC